MKVVNKMASIYDIVRDFKKRYPMTIAWRLKSHSKVVEKHLNPEEEVYYAFCAQKNDSFFNIFTTCVVAITSKRIVIAQKRPLIGYYFTSITPDLFNDLKVKSGILFGKVYIDTVKEFTCFSNIQLKALPEIETNVTEYVMREKKKYGNLGREND